MEDDLNTRQEEIRCLMCRETTEELKVLECFHLFCVNCLSTHVALKEDGATFGCPSCKATTRLPRCSDFASLETNGHHCQTAKASSEVWTEVNDNQESNSPMGLDAMKTQVLKVTGEFVMTGMGESLRKPCAIAVNKTNTKIAITDWKSDAIAVFNIDGEFLNKIQITEEGCKPLRGPHGVAFLNNNDIVVADCNNHRIVIFDTATGRVLKCFGRQGQDIGEFNYPFHVHVDEQGRIIVCDGTRVQVFTGDGTYQFHVDKPGNEFSHFSAVSHGDTLFVSDVINHVIHVVELQEGNSVSKRCIGGPGCRDGELMEPWGLAIDRDNNLLVCDLRNYRIQKFTMEGRFIGKTHRDINQPWYLTVLDDGRKLVTGYYTNLITVVE